MQINKNLSAAISVARGLALFSIVSAHIMFLKGTPAVFSNFYANFGTIGVVAYYIISGYLFAPEHYGGFFKMLKNKAKAIGLPWVVLGSTVYFYKVYFTRVYSLKAHVKWLLGKNTYLYFITVLLLCFVICYFVKNKAALWGFVGLNVLSLELTAFGVLQPAIAFLRITNNLNLFNWLGFFALGRLARGLNGELFKKGPRLAVVAVCRGNGLVADFGVKKHLHITPWLAVRAAGRGGNFWVGHLCRA